MNFTNLQHINNPALFSTAKSIKEFKDQIKAASVFGLVVGNIELSGQFSDRSTKDIEEDKETLEWYENSEHNTKGYKEVFTDEDYTVESYHHVEAIKGNTIHMRADSTKYTVRFPLYPKTEDVRGVWDSAPVINIWFVKPEQD